MESNTAGRVNNGAATQEHLRHALLLARTRLQTNNYAELRHVSCDADGKVLRLEGHVSRYYLKQMAQHLVVDLKEFDGVDNRITVPVHQRASFGSDRRPSLLPWPETTVANAGLNQ